MAIPAEAIRNHHSPRLEVISRPEEMHVRYAPGTFLDNLDTTRDSPHFSEMPRYMDLSALEQSVYQIRDFVVLLRQRGVREDCIEVGRNSYYNPLDRTSYAAPLVYKVTPLVNGETGEVQVPELPDVYQNLQHLSRKGLQPRHTEHFHPSPFPAFPSYSDQLVFFAKQKEGGDTPMVIAQTIHGNGVQVTLFRTAETPGLVTAQEGKEREDEFKKFYKTYGDQIHDRREDQIKADFAQEMRLRCYISFDETLDRAEAMSPYQIIDILHARQRQSVTTHSW